MGLFVLNLDVHLTGAGGGDSLDVLRVSRLTMAVTMSLLSPVTVTKDDKANDVDKETHSAHNQDHLRVLDGLRLDKPLESLDRDGEAESQEKDCVNQGPHHLGPGESKSVRVTLSGAQSEVKSH